MVGRLPRIFRSRYLWILAFGFGLGQLMEVRFLAADPNVRTANAAVPSPETEAEYHERVVAYVYGNVPVTRAQLGEFLIARYGAEKLPLLVNRIIIEREAEKRGVTVTQQEIDAALEQDLKDLGVNKKDFIRVVLKNYGKTLYEWEQDVIKPRLMLTAMCRDQVKVSEEDLQKMFEHLYGEKVRCRIIMWPKGSERAAQVAYDKIRKSEEEFARAARTQSDPTLAPAGGQIAPIARHSYGETNIIEKEAFQLKPGELSRLITTPQGVMVLKCDEIIPPDSTKNFEEERDNLRKEFIKRQIQVEIPKLFAQLQKEANPKLLLKGADPEPGELEKSVQQELGGVTPASGQKK